MLMHFLVFLLVILGLSSLMFVASIVTDGIVDSLFGIFIVLNGIWQIFSWIWHISSTAV
jgi:hypothetical protein